MGDEQETARWGRKWGRNTFPAEGLEGRTSQGSGFCGHCKYIISGSSVQSVRKTGTKVGGKRTAEGKHGRPGRGARRSAFVNLGGTVTQGMGCVWVVAVSLFLFLFRFDHFPSICLNGFFFMKHIY